MADKKRVNPVVVGAVGVAVGAAAVALADQKNRKKALKIAGELKTQTTKHVAILTEKAKAMRGTKVAKSSRKKIIAPKRASSHNQRRVSQAN